MCVFKVTVTFFVLRKGKDELNTVMYSLQLSIATTLCLCWITAASHSRTMFRDVHLYVFTASETSIWVLAHCCLVPGFQACNMQAHQNFSPFQRVLPCNRASWLQHIAKILYLWRGLKLGWKMMYCVCTAGKFPILWFFYFRTAFLSEGQAALLHLFPWWPRSCVFSALRAHHSVRLDSALAPSPLRISSLLVSQESSSAMR